MPLLSVFLFMITEHLKGFLFFSCKFRDSFGIPGEQSNVFKCIEHLESRKCSIYIYIYEYKCFIYFFYIFIVYIYVCIYNFCEIIVL